MNRVLKKIKPDDPSNCVYNMNIDEIVSPINDDLDKKTATSIIMKFLSVTHLDKIDRINVSPGADDCTIIFHYSGDHGINGNQVCAIISDFCDYTINWSIYPEKDPKTDTYIGQCFSYTFVLGRNNYVVTRTNFKTTWSTTIQRGTADQVIDHEHKLLEMPNNLFTQSSVNFGQFYNSMNQQWENH